LNIESGLTPDKIEYYKKLSYGKEIKSLGDGRKKIKDLKVEIFNFFYSKYYNPCLGHQVAIDTGGEIKCCLWSEEVLGNIGTDDLKDMIIRGVFDKYWEYTKSKIESCKDCELRVACDDCRIFALQHTGKLEAKPPYCAYDPYTGEDIPS
jgi:radical SAM protein with 4Fe4S-binding SPASM domain